VKLWLENGLKRRCGERNWVRGIFDKKMRSAGIERGAVHTLRQPQFRVTDDVLHRERLRSNLELLAGLQTRRKEQNDTLAAARKR
jgi:hypothetical protein